MEKREAIKSKAFNSQTNDESIKIYPNPAQYKITVVSSKIPDKIELFTLSGQKVLGVTSRLSTTTVDVSNLLSGIYVIKVQINSELFTKKLIVNK